MRNGQAQNQFVTADASLARVTWITLAVGGLLSGTWLWSCWCSFPSIPWNDIRVAPAVALHHGISIYSLPSSGPVSTWIYGPVPLLLLWPAGLARSAAGAIQVAGAIHIGLTVLALTLTCLFWPAAATPDRRAQGWQRRMAAALLCVLLVRNQTSGYVVYNADAPGLVLGLLSLLVLVHGRHWPAAACAAAAVACKQTLIGVALAQLVWLFVAVSPGAAGRQAGRCFVAGAVTAGAAVAIFGGPGLWHTMIELPGRFPWASVPERLHNHGAYLLIHIGLPLAVMLVWHRLFFNRNAPVLLPALAFFCTLPLSLAGLFKVGGNVNSLHSFWLWFPPVLVALITAKPIVRFGQAGCLALALLATAVASLWLQVSTLRVRPNLRAYHEAAQLADRWPERIWFPMHPLVTLYSDGRFYHDFDGLGERALAGQRLTDEHYYSHMPRHRQAAATLLPIGWGPADTTDARLPRNAPISTFGHWRLDGTLD